MFVVHLLNGLDFGAVVLEKLDSSLKSRIWKEI